MDERNDHLQASLETFRLLVTERHDDHLGKLAKVPRFGQIRSLLCNKLGRGFHLTIHDTVNKLGRAMQLGQHRRLIDSINMSLGHDTLAAMTSTAWDKPEVCAALAVHLTTLEQAYHWPGDESVTTPRMLEEHKIVIQTLNQPQLREILDSALAYRTLHRQDPAQPKEIAQLALLLARSILDEARLTQDRGETLSRDAQDTVNLLYRTCRSDWNDQGDYSDVDSHKEFGRLHEVLRASGTQRRMQELFEESEGLLCLQAMTSLVDRLPLTFNLVKDALIQLQFSVALVREELFTVSVDEVIWGRAFANFSKAVGFCDISAGGGDAPIFCMLDSLFPKGQASLADELDFRARFFPPNMRNLVARMRGLPGIREYCNSPRASNDLRRALRALERQRYELYEMHRKKAARIGVSLRAGQKGTSAGVGVCAYATPEKTIATTLSTAMTARFGSEGETFSIEAKAQAHSLMFDEHRNVYSARVRFEFSTRLAVGPGDCLLVSVQLADGVWETRTYSVTYTYASHRPLESKALQLAGAAEAYVRSKGVVSRYLCGQTEGVAVRVAIKPASHFRLEANLHAAEKTIFIAQGGALGIFVAWLETQTHLIGRYVLVVATRQFSHLGFTTELLTLAKSLQHCLQIVVACSKPAETDIPLLESAGIETYRGRVTQYLGCCSLEALRVAYVCGTSSFGLGVAKSLSLTQDHTEYPHRLEPIITSRMPSIRLHVAPEAPPVRELPSISLVELAQHNAPGDLWIAVGSNVYDITALSQFHPGGEKTLISRAGRQAEDLFNSVHGGQVDIESLLQNMLVGQLTPSNPSETIWESRMDKIVEMQNDLMNHSRFEKLPSQLTVDLAECPPTNVIYASMEHFTQQWCSLIQEVGVPPLKQCELMRAWHKLQGRLDAGQATVYTASFDDVERCGQVVREVFDGLRTIAGEVHAALDAVKTHLRIRFSSGCEPDCGAFEDCMRKVLIAIDCQTQRFSA